MAGMLTLPIWSMILIGVNGTMQQDRPHQAQFDAPTILEEVIVTS